MPPMKQEHQLFFFATEPSPKDERDWSAENIYDTTYDLPTKLDLRNNLTMVRNQGNQGTCAAQTAACMKEWQEKKDINFDGYMSPQFIYNNRENQTTSGMYGRDLMRILSKIGVCAETSYPYKKIEKRENIDQKYFDEAKNHLISGYAQVHSIDSLKRALYRNGPCFIAFPVYNNGTSMWKAKEGENMKGGHAMTVVGYDDKGFIIRNSWGVFWGDLGYCHYPYEDWGSHFEIWTTIDANSYEPPAKPESLFSLFMKFLSKFL